MTTRQRDTAITKRFTFEAAHQLYNHTGKCRRPHGHSYIVDVTIAGPVRPANGQSDEGMVVDFGQVSAIWKADCEPLLDHQDLNETIGGECGPTTAENIAAWIFDRFDAHVHGPGWVLRVRVAETATGSATVGVV